MPQYAKKIMEQYDKKGEVGGGGFPGPFPGALTNAHGFSCLLGSRKASVLAWGLGIAGASSSLKPGVEFGGVSRITRSPNAAARARCARGWRSSPRPRRTAGQPERTVLWPCWTVCRRPAGLLCGPAGLRCCSARLRNDNSTVLRHQAPHLAPLPLTADFRSNRILTPRPAAAAAAGARPVWLSPRGGRGRVRLASWAQHPPCL